jgi:hypothetical protein
MLHIGFDVVMGGLLQKESKFREPKYITWVKK